MFEEDFDDRSEGISCAAAHAHDVVLSVVVAVEVDAGKDYSVAILEGLAGGTDEDFLRAMVKVDLRARPFSGSACAVDNYINAQRAPIGQVFFSIEVWDISIAYAQGFDTLRIVSSQAYILGPEAKVGIGFEERRQSRQVGNV